MQLTKIQREVYRRYAELALPRHTSYPAVPFWQPFGEDEFRAAIERSNERGGDLSLYVHVPFCERLCYYCTCTKQILPRRDDARWAKATADYLERLEREIARVAAVVDTNRSVRQIHLGGGTPTYLSGTQLVELMAAVHRQFEVDASAEVSIELDPRVTSLDQLHTLRKLGFNRVSLGVQDFNAQVQQAVNRIQPLEQVAAFTADCRKLGFQSINFDLIYGLPFQTPDTLAETIRQTIALGPDRVALYRMAVIPELFRWQNVFRSDDLPAPDDTCDMFLNAIEAFEAASYQFIGLDHFARPDDDLARAAQTGSLRRTFQGMTTGGGLDVLGFGPSAISIFADAYAQNAKSLEEWSTDIDVGQLATCRGLNLSEEDLLRQAVIEHLYCNAAIDKARIEKRFGIDFDEQFADELARLTELDNDGLVELGHSHIRLAFPLGRLLLRVVAAVFDTYLPRDAFRIGQSAQLVSKVG